MQNISDETKWILYVALNVAVCAALVVGATIAGGSLARLPYVMLLFAVCSSPIPFTTRLNGRFAMLGVAMFAYFVVFGLLDAVLMLSPPAVAAESKGILDAAEIVLLMGALMHVVGFHLGARLVGAPADPGPAKDWPRSLLLALGLLLWSAGCVAVLYQALVVQVDNSQAAVVSGLTKLGVWRTSGLILITTYAGRLGVVILAYWWAVAGRRFSDALVLGVIAVQFVVGWVVDTKEVALGAPLVMLLTRFVVLGRVPTRWLVCSMIGIALVFPVLTAKRIIMTEGLHLTRAQALSRTSEILWRAIQERNVAKTGTKYEQKTQSFLERVTDKPSVEIFVEHVGKDKPYKMGATFEPMLYVFVPRVVWSDKPGDNSSQTFNREFHLSEDPDTHIDTTHVGELYWNFGFFGVLIGMGFAGALLGFVCARFDPSAQTSMTRTLVIIVTMYDLVAHAAGQIELDYVVWLRTLLLIGVLHLLFARAAVQRIRGAVARSVQFGAELQAQQVVRFPNLMR